MTPERRDLCIHITQKLMTYPCAKFFLEPVDPKNAPKYYDIIKCPQDLSSILKRLENNEYNYVGHWKRDIELIWYNAEKYNGSQSEINLLAQSLADHFHRKVKILHIQNISEWTSATYNLAKIMLSTTATPPPSIRKDFPSELFADNARVFSDGEFRGLLTALKFLHKPSDRMHIFSILEKYDSQTYMESIIKYSAPIDLRNLSTQSLLALQLYARERFKEDNRPYPES